MAESTPLRSRASQAGGNCPRGVDVVEVSPDVRPAGGFSDVVALHRACQSLAVIDP